MALSYYFRKLVFKNKRNVDFPRQSHKIGKLSKKVDFPRQNLKILKWPNKVKTLIYCQNSNCVLSVKADSNKRLIKFKFPHAFQILN